MHDWRKFVQVQLAGLPLSPGMKADEVDELAGHLEEVCEGLQRQGMTEELAAQRAMRQVTDWNALQRHIRNAKEREDLMHNRVRQLWFPGLLTLTLSTGLLPMLLKLGLEPRIVSWSGPDTILFYIPWLMTLPLFGALARGLYLASRWWIRARDFVLGHLSDAIACRLFFRHPPAQYRIGSQYCVPSDTGWFLGPLA